MPTVSQKMRDHLDMAAMSQEVTVLVWGPGPTLPEEHEKRIKIRDEIKNAFRYAEVHFSEDIEKAARDVIGTAGDSVTLRDIELLHLTASDIAIVLDCGAGPGAEIATFGPTALGAKLYIFTPERYKSTKSFPASIREGLNVYHYSDDDMKQCRLVERSVSYLKLIALKKLSGI